MRAFNYGHSLLTHLNPDFHRGSQKFSEHGKLAVDKLGVLLRVNANTIFVAFCLAGKHAEPEFHVKTH